MLKTFGKIWQLLDTVERRKFILIFVGMLVSALLELFSIGALFPFLSVLTNPEIVHSNSILSKIYAYLGLDDEVMFLMVIGAGVAFVLLLSTIFKSLLNYQKYKFINFNRHCFAERLMRKYLAQPYSFFLVNSSNSLSKNVLSEIDQFIDRAFLPILQIMTFSCVIFLITAFLFVVSPYIPIILICFLGGGYLSFYLLFKKKLVAISDERFKANELRFKSATELFSGIKEFKAFGKEHVYLANFVGASSLFCDKRTFYDALSDIPKYIIETVGFMVMLLLCFLLLYQGTQVEELIATLGLFAFAGYKLLPAMQQVYFNFIQLRFGRASIENTLNNLCYDVSMGNEETGAPQKTITDQRTLAFDRSLTFKNVFYTYPETETSSLVDVSFKVLPGDKLAISGPTGAGKSTLVDLILGLIAPSKGVVEVDDTVLNSSRVAQWQGKIGYVPQHTFLLDDSIAANIALGGDNSNNDSMNEDLVHDAARQARIHDFILGLPDGYNTIIGERGIRLSGGQRQRISIARALYRDPDILLLDEATSSLDSQTEADVLSAIDQVSKDKTIIMITHRESTLKFFDKVLKIENGLCVSPNSNKVV